MKVKGLQGDLHGIGENEPEQKLTNQDTTKHNGKEPEFEDDANDIIVKGSIIDSLEEINDSF